MRGGSVSISVRGPKRQEGAYESLKALIALDTEVGFLKIFSSFLFVWYFQL